MSERDAGPEDALDTDLDQALLRFQQTDLEWGGGLANHGPMAAEALTALGHPSLIQGLVDVYAARMPPLRSGQPIPRAERASALGDAKRLPDWVATYDLEIAQRPWRELLRDELPRLIPGLFAGAAHGLLRVAHGVRAVEARDTKVRRRELALGLAYWAGRYQELPGTPGARPRAGQGVAETFAGLQVVPPDRRKPGLFFDAVRVLDADFAAWVEAFDAGDRAPEDGVHEICRASAQLYLANPGARIAYVHCLTAPSALRLIGHYLEPSERGVAVGYALQAALALDAVSAGEPVDRDDPEVDRLAASPVEIRYRAACSVEEHAVKMTEACLREYAAQPDPIFLQAAADAAVHLDSGAGRGGKC